MMDSSAERKQERDTGENGRHIRGKRHRFLALRYGSVRGRAASFPSDDRTVRLSDDTQIGLNS